MERWPEPFKWPVDILAVLEWLGALLHDFTELVALLAALTSLIWGCIRLYEIKTMKAYLQKRSANELPERPSS